MAIFSYNDASALIERLTAVLSSNDHVSKAVSRGFIERLDLLVSVLNVYYLENKVLALNLLQIQDYLNALSASLSRNSDKLTSQFRSQIDALRLVNSEQVSKIVQLLESAQQTLSGSRFVAILGSEELKIGDFRQILSDHPGIKVIEVRPRNSPVAVFLELLQAEALIWLISAVLTTRFHSEISGEELVDREQDAALEEVAESLPDKSTKSDGDNQKALIRINRNIEVGLISREEMDIGVRITRAFQGGLVKKFELSFSPKRAVEFHKSLLKLIGGYARTGK